MLRTLLLILVISKSQAQSSLFQKKLDGSAGTPENNTVFGSNCIGNLTSLTCSPVSFLILTDPSTVKVLELEAINKTIFKADGTQTCAEPSGLFDQKCGVDTLYKSSTQLATTALGYGVFPDTFVGCAVSSCDFNLASGACQGDQKYCKCTCTVGGSGDGGSSSPYCTCFNTTRFTVQPIFFQSLQDSRICFIAYPWSATALPERRCVYVAMLVPSTSLLVTLGDAGPEPTAPPAAISGTDAVVGSPLLLTVRTRSLQPFEPLDIDLKPPQATLPDRQWEALQAELPSQAWQGPTTCSSSGKPASAISLASPCARGWWHRTLQYVPRISELGMTYAVGFQVTRYGLAARTFAGQTGSQAFKDPLAGAVNGTACGARVGLCSLVQGTPDDRSGVLVRVRQDLPTFVVNINTSITSTMRFAFSPGTPPAGSTARGYPNCPLAPLGVFALRARASVPLTLTLRPGMPDAAKLGLSTRGVDASATFSELTSPRDGVLSPDLAGTWAYAQVRWTPPPAAAGRTYPVCFEAADTSSSSSHCFNIEVVACMYCLSPGGAGRQQDTLQSLAARFGTHWLQVWSANDGDLATDVDPWVGYRGEEATTLQPWAYPVDPAAVGGNTLVRLGPTYRLRHPTSLAALAARFQTTVAALAALNPGLADPLRGRPGADAAAEPPEPELAALLAPAGALVCVAPQICAPPPPAAAA